MAVQKHVDPVRMREHVRIGPRLRGGLRPQMSQNVHVVRACGSRAVHRVLHGAVERFAGLILHKAVDVFARLILEMRRRGRGQRFRRRDPDEGDLHARGLQDHVRLQDPLAIFREVAADIRVVRLFDQRKELVGAVIEFVVAGDRDVVLQGVHELDDGLALRQRAQRLPLHGVAVVDQKGRIPLRLQRIADLPQPGVAEAFVNAAVNVAGE